jgi:hypothetical protein
MRSAPTRPFSAILLLVAGMGLLFHSGCVWDWRGRARAAGTSGGLDHEFPPILGRGVNRDYAQKDALKRAATVVDEYLHEREPRLEWRPSPAYIRQHLFKGDPEEVPDKEEHLDADTIVRCWRWSLAVSPDDWHEIKRLDRRARVDERMLLLARILAGLVALLAVVAGYIRADDWTKGYYTGWLRAGAVVALALVTVALIWLPA